MIQKQKHRARQEDPRPYDSDWGWWVESRLCRLENGQMWLIHIAAGALVAEVIRILLQTTGLIP